MVAMEGDLVESTGTEAQVSSLAEQIERFSIEQARDPVLVIPRLQKTVGYSAAAALRAISRVLGQEAGNELPLDLPKADADSTEVQAKVLQTMWEDYDQKFDATWKGKDFLSSKNIKDRFSLRVDASATRLVDKWLYRISDHFLQQEADGDVESNLLSRMMGKIFPLLNALSDLQQNQHAVAILNTKLSLAIRLNRDANDDEGATDYSAICKQIAQENGTDVKQIYKVVGMLKRFAKLSSVQISLYLAIQLGLPVVVGLSGSLSSEIHEHAADIMRAEVGAAVLMLMTKAVGDASLYKRDGVTNDAFQSLLVNPMVMRAFRRCPLLMKVLKEDPLVPLAVGNFIYEVAHYIIPQIPTYAIALGISQQTDSPSVPLATLTGDTASIFMGVLTSMLWLLTKQVPEVKK